MTRDEELLIGVYDGYTLYKEVRTPTWYYECEEWEWEKLDISEVWVRGETEEFKKTPCVSANYWDMEKDLPKQWEDWQYGFKYDTDWNALIPVVKRAMFEIHMEISEDPLAILGGDDERKKELRRTRDKLENTLLICDIEKLHPVVVQAIKLITGNKQQ